jgi:hypothetical protein
MRVCWRGPHPGRCKAGIFGQTRAGFGWKDLAQRREALWCDLRGAEVAQRLNYRAAGPVRSREVPRRSLAKAPGSRVAAASPPLFVSRGNRAGTAPPLCLNLEGVMHVSQTAGALLPAHPERRLSRRRMGRRDSRPSVRAPKCMMTRSSGIQT